MLDDLFEGILDGFVAGEPSKRVQIILRVLFGLVGTGLAAAGIYHIMGYDAGLPFRLAGAVVFFFLGCFCIFNIALLKSWRWPGRYFVYSFIGLFAVRIIFGA